MRQTPPERLIIALQLLLGAGVADKVVAGQHLDPHPFGDQPFGNGTTQHIHDHRAGDGGSGAGAPFQAFDLDDTVALGTVVVQDNVGIDDQLFTGRVTRLGILTVLAREHGNDRHSAFFGPARHLDNDGANAAGGDDDKGIVRAKFETV